MMSSIDSLNIAHAAEKAHGSFLALLLQFSYLICISQGAKCYNAAVSSEANGLLYTLTLSNSLRSMSMSMTLHHMQHLKSQGFEVDQSIGSIERFRSERLRTNMDLSDDSNLSCTVLLQYSPFAGVDIDAKPK